MSQSDPIFKSIFGRQWSNLPEVMHQHYANRPHSRDRVRIDGQMSVERSTLAQRFSRLFKWAGITPYAGNHIPVTVFFHSEPHSDAYCLERYFRYPDRGIVAMRSRMRPIGENLVVETMKSGLGWCARYHYDSQRILLKHEGFCFTVMGRTFALPLTWLLGRCTASEEAIDNSHFRMHAALKHPLWGMVYAYGGTFQITEVLLHD